MSKRLEILRTLRDYFSERADAEYFTDSPSPVANEEMKMLALVEELEAPASGEAGPVAWLVTNSRLWKDRAFISKAGAEKCVAERKDSSGAIPLYAHPTAKVPEALWEALADCVSCFNCPEWSDKCEEVERRATKLLNSTTPTPATTPETEWVKCEYRLPEKGVVVLVNVDYDHHSIKPSVLTAHWTGSTFKIGPNSVNFNCDAPAVTHWRQLPAPPQEQ